jgi:phage shock protein PspC (stress-responsive transcriptional regulator)
MMQSSKGNLFTRDDTFFGVCEGLGEDLRIPANLFRVAFALGFFFAPVPVVIAYLALGALVLASRLVFPNPRSAPAAVAARAAEPAPVPVASEDQMDLELLPIAA